MTDQDKITELEKNYAVMDNKMQNISEIVIQIRDNHLVHLSNDVKSIATTLDTRIATFGTYVDTRITNLEKNLMGRIDTLTENIQRLRVVDAKQEPTQGIISKIIEVVIIGVVGAVLALVIRQTI